jgi:phosphoglycolate phosphatase
MRRLVLFDIDGTLLSTNGAARRAFHRALLEVFGTAGAITGHPFDGKTDPQIARELLTDAGLPSAMVDRQLPALWPVYLRELAIELSQPGHSTTLYPGVTELLDALAQQPETALVGLLTGNIQPGAELKLASVRLGGRFAVGAFGSDGERRDALPAVAVARAKQLCGTAFHGEAIVIIGDTPHDVTCGRSLGVRSIGVATGSYDRSALQDAGAHATLPDFQDVDAALAAIFTGS